MVNGLAYTRFGGETLPIEVTYYPGEGNLILTGSLGDVMKESCHIAFGYVKSNYKKFGIESHLLSKKDIHIHVPEGAVPKDGPSAGVAITTALISALTHRKVPSDIAMTGEITLRGKVLPIGGLKEKSIGAHRNHIKTLILPYENKRDIDEVPNEIRNELQFYPVTNYMDIYQYLFKK